MQVLGAMLFSGTSAWRYLGALGVAVALAALGCSSKGLCMLLGVPIGLSHWAGFPMLWPVAVLGAWAGTATVALGVSGGAPRGSALCAVLVSPLLWWVVSFALELLAELALDTSTSDPVPGRVADGTGMAVRGSVPRVSTRASAASSSAVNVSDVSGVRCAGQHVRILQLRRGHGLPNCPLRGDAACDMGGSCADARAPRRPCAWLGRRVLLAGAHALYDTSLWSLESLVYNRLLECAAPYERGGSRPPALHLIAYDTVAAQWSLSPNASASYAQRWKRYLAQATHDARLEGHSQQT